MRDAVAGFLLLTLVRFGEAWSIPAEDGWMLLILLVIEDSVGHPALRGKKDNTIPLDLRGSVTTWRSCSENTRTEGLIW